MILDTRMSEFMDLKDIYVDENERFCDRNKDLSIRYLISYNIREDSDRLTKNIQYFGDAHTFD